MLLSIPPKHSVSQVMEYTKDKSAIHLARTKGKRRNLVGEHFWGRAYWASTVGHNEAALRLYIQEQEKQTNASISWDCSEAKAALSGSKINPL